MDLRVTLLASAVALAASGYVGFRARTAPAPSVGVPATDAQDATVAARVASSEPGWRRESEQDFPADQWSQRDAFHGHEVALIRELAGAGHTSYEEVIRAIDEDIHRMQGRADRSAAAVPCKPRPFYD
ncbi:MAG: hypothetical protein JWP97_2731 [Labilithrix sp.]|nr:hypothetical protein [Labilithrix sp.]